MKGFTANYISIFLISSLLISGGCKMEKESKLSLITKTELLNFPSASSIEYFNGIIYVIGDDARKLAILDKNYRLEDTVDLFPGESLRIPKKIKTDLEASTIIQYKDRNHLMVAGSASRPEREFIMLFPLDSLQTYEKITTHAFVVKLRSMGMKPVNFEGLAAIKNMLVFGNRGNLKNPDNHFVVVRDSLITDMENTTPHVIDFNLSEDGQFKGVSGLAYIESLDLLLFTATIENTDNEIDDGGIGNSYLGYITSFAGRLNDSTIKPDVLWNLSGMQPEFVNEKIESVAVESVGSELILHLVADNDNGTSTLFKVSLSNPLR